MEIWKDVPGYVGLYQVSNYGNVKSILYNKILKSCWRNSKKEYKTVYLSNCNKRNKKRKTAGGYIWKIK